MPLPFIIGGIAAAAGAIGVGSGIHGGAKLIEANATMKEAERKREDAVRRFERKNTETNNLMDALGKQELKILQSFEKFQDIISKIQGRPEFKSYSKDSVNLPKYDAPELRKVSAGAGALLGGLGGAVAGTAGGYAAAGATYSAVMALGTASTGTAISSLSGVAATNAALAALGGGSLAAGGGGMALGATVLSGATLGAGLLVGGIIANITGCKLSDKADEAFRQAEKISKDVDDIVRYLVTLLSTAKIFQSSLSSVELEYRKRLDSLNHIVNVSGKTQWVRFSDKEKLLTQNTILLVGLLYQMCNVNLVLTNKMEYSINSVNTNAVHKSTKEAETFLNDLHKDAVNESMKEAEIILNDLNSSIDPLEISDEKDSIMKTQIGIRAKNGHADSQNELGMRYFEGRGVTQDKSKAFKWFMVAAGQGHPEAQNNVGMCYYNGFGTDSNRQKSMEWLERSAAQGFSSARDNLRKWYGM